MNISIANYDDLKDLLLLYTDLHDNKMPEMDAKILSIYQSILDDKNHYIIVRKENSEIVSSAVLIIIPNLTRNHRPYALIENVVTKENYRKNGYGKSVLNYAKEIAIKNNCYKIMLMTGSKEESVLNFYKSVGYNKNDKTAFIQWL